ncbi:MAG TPA: glutamate decarboxylase, partial [Actinomycetota bacterium]
MALHRHVSGPRGQAHIGMRPQSRFQLPAELGEVPRFALGPRGLGPDGAYQVVHDELLLDGNARLNLATFVTTWMDRQADILMLECASKNLIDKDEYPQT